MDKNKQDFIKIVKKIRLKTIIGLVFTSLWSILLFIIAYRSENRFIDIIIMIGLLVQYPATRVREDLVRQCKEKLAS